MKKIYGVMSGYHSLFVKEIKYEDGKFKPIGYCKNNEEIPRVSKKEAIEMCEKLNASDYFAQRSGVGSYTVWELKQITD